MLAELGFRVCKQASLPAAQSNPNSVPNGKKPIASAISKYQKHRMKTELCVCGRTTNKRPVINLTRKRGRGVDRETAAGSRGWGDCSRKWRMRWIGRL